MGGARWARPATRRVRTYRSLLEVVYARHRARPRRATALRSLNQKRIEGRAGAAHAALSCPGTRQKGRSSHLAHCSDRSAHSRNHTQNRALHCCKGACARHVGAYSARELNELDPSRVAKGACASGSQRACQRQLQRLINSVGRAGPAVSRACAVVSPWTSASASRSGCGH